MSEKISLDSSDDDEENQRAFPLLFTVAYFHLGFFST